MARGDLLDLRWREIDFANGLILRQRGKTGVMSTIPLSSRLRDPLAALPGEHAPDSLVFVTPEGRPHSWTTFRRYHKAELEIAGITARPAALSRLVPRLAGRLAGEDRLRVGSLFDRYDEALQSRLPRVRAGSRGDHRRPIRTVQSLNATRLTCTFLTGQDRSAEPFDGHHMGITIKAIPVHDRTNSKRCATIPSADIRATHNMLCFYLTSLRSGLTLDRNRDFSATSKKEYR